MPVPSSSVHCDSRWTTRTILTPRYCLGTTCTWSFTVCCKTYRASQRGEKSGVSSPRAPACLLLYDHHRVSLRIICLTVLRYLEFTMDPNLSPRYLRRGAEYGRYCSCTGDTERRRRCSKGPWLQRSHFNDIGLCFPAFDSSSTSSSDPIRAVGLGSSIRRSSL